MINITLSLALAGIYQLSQVDLVEIGFCNHYACGATCMRNEIAVFFIKELHVKAVYLVKNRHEVPGLSLPDINSFAVNYVQLLLITQDTKFIHCH